MSCNHNFIINNATLHLALKRRWYTRRCDFFLFLPIKAFFYEPSLERKTVMDKRNDENWPMRMGTRIIEIFVMTILATLDIVYFHFCTSLTRNQRKKQNKRKQQQRNTSPLIWRRHFCRESWFGVWPWRTEPRVPSSRSENPSRWTLPVTILPVQRKSHFQSAHSRRIDNRSVIILAGVARSPLHDTQTLLKMTTRSAASQT